MKAVKTLFIVPISTNVVCFCPLANVLGASWLNTLDVDQEQSDLGPPCLPSLH